MHLRCEKERAVLAKGSVLVEVFGEGDSQKQRHITSVVGSLLARARTRVRYR